MAESIIHKTGRLFTGSSASSLSVPTGVYTTLATITLPKGTYVISGGFEWKTTFTQLSIGAFGRGSSAATILGTLVRHTGSYGGGYNATTVLRVEEDNYPVTLRAYQASSSAKTAQNAIIQAVRID